MQLIVSPSGDVHCLYDETIDLQQLGQLNIRRGSHVEPTNDGQWTADMAPLGGPTLGPYLLRSEALSKERDWILQYWLPTAGTSAESR